MSDDYVKRSDAHKVFQPKHAPAINKTFAAMIDSVPAADVVERPHWIPVTERLPEDEEMVLCFTPVDGYMFVGFHFSYKWGRNTVSKWRIITAMRSTKDITKKVTHWMSLPEPPKEEN